MERTVMVEREKGYPFVSNNMEDMMFLFGKKAKIEQQEVAIRDERVTVFADYEYWSTNLKGRFSVEPDINEWLDSVTEGRECNQIFFYGEFFQDKVKEAFLEKISQSYRSKTQLIAPEMSEKMTQKGKASIAMLCGMYEKLLAGEMSDIVVLFTGDGNYRQIISTMRKQGKQIILYSVKGVFADILPLGVEEKYLIPEKKEKKDKAKKNKKSYENMILKSLSFLDASGKKATYGKTIANVAKHNHVPNKKIHETLDKFIADGYIGCEEVAFDGKQVPVLVANWDKLEKDGIWEQRAE